ncbi:hypothetical protein [Neisseria dumasiana]|uniref:Uncharacterized protein n=1 Tax=Neisseria dumasiana TaxID=1931275 RepID=A0A1X3DKE8_9NEIS|nr:hypothetical protein [Neisseria dumasiana]OSI24643.1 hypothetical protein BV912_01970 [Neisseria dumasiana]
MYETAAEEGLRFYSAVADCLAQCAAAFGGGIDVYGKCNLLDLLRWTHRAILVTRGNEENE